MNACIENGTTFTRRGWISISSISSTQPLDFHGVKGNRETVTPSEDLHNRRGPKYVVNVRKTPVLGAPEAPVLDSINTATVAGLRDRAPCKKIPGSEYAVG